MQDINHNKNIPAIRYSSHKIPVIPDIQASCCQKCLRFITPYTTEDYVVRSYIRNGKTTVIAFHETCFISLDSCEACSKPITPYDSLEYHDFTPYHPWCANTPSQIYLCDTCNRVLTPYTSKTRCLDFCSDECSYV